MKRKDIKVGEEYACHGNGRGDVHSGKRVHVKEVGVERTGHGYATGCATSHQFTQRDGVLCLVLDNASGAAIGDCIVVSTREVQKPWAEYAVEHRAYTEKRREQEVRKAHQLACGRKALDILTQHGVEAKLNKYRPAITVEFDALHTLAEVLDKYL